MSVTVKQKNPGWIEKLKLILEGEGKNECAVGYPRGGEGANKHYENGASLLDVAIWNNFGTETIKRRPFLDQAEPKMQAEYKKIMREAQPHINAGKTSGEAVLKAAGLKCVAIVQEEIIGGNFEPNAPATIAKKKSSQPLIDTGDLRKYVSSVVRPKGSK